MEEGIEGRKNYPTEEVDPEHFLDDDKVKKMVENIENIKFKQEDFLNLKKTIENEKTN